MMVDMQDANCSSEGQTRDYVPLLGFKNEVQTLRQLIRDAIEECEYCTALVYGQLGMGKTTFVNYCLNSVSCVKDCKQIRLDGNVHGNDVKTINYIGKCLQIAADNDAFGGDMIKLLQQFEDRYKDTSDGPGVIVVIDQFDVFCRKNQLILYNFFEALQRVKRVLVVGMTVRYDCIELIEKRVKSRMSHKIIKLSAPYTNLDDYMEFAARLMHAVTQQDENEHMAACEAGSSFFTEDERKQLQIIYGSKKSIRSLRAGLLRIKLARQAKQKQRKLKAPALHQNPKIRLMSDLTSLELAILLICYKLVYIMGHSHFNYVLIYAFAKDLPKQLVASERVIYTVLGQLIDYDLLLFDNLNAQCSFAGNSHKQRLHITEWTPLRINISKLCVLQSLKLLENSIPTYLRTLTQVQH